MNPPPASGLAVASPELPSADTEPAFLGTAPALPAPSLPRARIVDSVLPPVLGSPESPGRPLLIVLDDAEVLELRCLDPDQGAALHRRVSVWHEESGNIHGAIDHAVAAGEERRVGELLWTHVFNYLAHGRNDMVKRWLGGFTEEQVASDAALSLCAAHSYLTAGDAEIAGYWRSVAAAALERWSGHVPEIGSLSGSLRAGAFLIDAAVAQSGAARMGQDAARAYELEPEHSPWRTMCCLYRGVASHLAGDTVDAREQLREGVRRSAAQAPAVEMSCLAQLAILALEEDDWVAAEDSCARASALIERRGLGDCPISALPMAVAALVCAHAGRGDEAKELLGDAMRLLERLGDFVPWYDLQSRVMLARTAVRLTDIPRARALLAEASRAGRRMPDAPAFERWLDEAWAELDSRAAAALDGSSSLTLAELRILRFLPTHLSFREIGERLHVSTNTVKSQAHAVYRKLDARSRSEAVAHAARLGLVWNVGNGADIRR
jgi:LuxR family maltose regulon positive regulatory protein